MSQKRDIYKRRQKRKSVSLVSPERWCPEPNALRILICLADMALSE